MENRGRPDRPSGAARPLNKSAIADVYPELSSHGLEIRRRGRYKPRSQNTAGPPDAAPAQGQGDSRNAMKPELHPLYPPAKIPCAGGNVMETRSTRGSSKVETGAAGPPFFRGKTSSWIPKAAW